MGESGSPPGDLDDHVTHPGLFPQAAAALVHCQVQPQGRVMWGKHSVLCLSTQLLSLCGGFKPFLLAFMLSMSGFFFNLMSFQSAFVPCQLYTHTHKCILQLILQPESVFKHFLGGLGIETGDLQSSPRGIQSRKQVGCLQLNQHMLLN